jgi:hypothetical protein
VLINTSGVLETILYELHATVPPHPPCSLTLASLPLPAGGER